MEADPVTRANGVYLMREEGELARLEIGGAKKKCCYEEGHSDLKQASMDLSLIQLGNTFGVEIL